MEDVRNEGTKSTKSKIKVGTDSLRVKRETKKRILSELAALNKKEFGKPITPDHFVALAISLLKPEHLQSLKDQSLTAKDRFEQRYRDYCDRHGKVSKDEFLGNLLSMQVSAT
jgi:hypothetical protein